MKVRSYPGRAVLEDSELLLDPDATRGRAMELLYEASWRECGVNWTSGPRAKTSSAVASGNESNDDNEACRAARPYADVISQLEGVLDGGASSPRDDRSPRSSSGTNSGTDSESSENTARTLNGHRKENQEQLQPTNQSGFLIPRPRLIVPVHTYARRRRTGAPQPIRRRIREGRTFVCRVPAGFRRPRGDPRTAI